MTAIELIENTIAYYREDLGRLAIDHGHCVYKGENNKRCALGRWLDLDDVSEEEIDRMNDYGSINQSVETDAIIFNHLKPEVKHIPVDLWRELQNYHDSILPPLINPIPSFKKYVKEVEKQLREKWKNN